MVDPVVATLFGVAVAFTKTLLRSTNNNLGADIIGDTAGPLAAVSQLVLGKRGSKKQVERTINRDLARRMRSMHERCYREGIDPDRLANPCAEVEAVLNTIGDHKRMLEQAVHDPDALRTDFKERALKQRAQVDERLVWACAQVVDGLFMRLLSRPLGVVRIRWGICRRGWCGCGGGCRSLRSRWRPRCRPGRGW